MNLKHLFHPNFGPLDLANQLLGLLPDQLPVLPPFQTPAFSDFEPLAAIVGADPSMQRATAEALLNDRALINSAVIEAGVIVSAAALEIHGAVRDLISQGMPLVPLLSNPATAAPAAIRLATIAAKVAYDVGQTLWSVEQSLQGHVETLNNIPGVAITAPPHAAAMLHQLERHIAAPAVPPELRTAAAVPEVNPTSADAPQAGAEPAANPAGAAAVAAAKSQLGTPYVWGGTGPGGFDCSGLTSWAYSQAGVELPRLAQEQAVGTQVAYEDLQPGDLAVWDGHVAMYAGDGMYIEAGDPVQLNPVRTDNIGMQFKGFWRPNT